jgi:hypothetical protein
MKTENIIMNNLRTMRKKKLTPQITEYLINAVIAPAVDYMVTDMCVGETKVRKWQKQIDTCFKGQYKLAKTIPESALRIKQLANIVSLEKKIKQNRIRNLEMMIEDENILEKTTEIRIMQM